MKTVGIRELKNRLSEYVRRVRSGESVLVTDRGEVVAELSSPGQASGGGTGPVALRTLARRKVLTPGAPNIPEVYPDLPPVPGARRAAELLDEERGPR
jgi:antitoxin (DNA-binding transcriptional repressor) of toxin-antitoxin stability system